MSTQLLESEPIAKAVDPYKLGWRQVKRRTNDGEVNYERVGLTYEDVLHPQEGDFIVQNQQHFLNGIYLYEALKQHLAHREDVLVLGDHRIDWQHPGIEPHGPDVTVLEHVTAPWTGEKATFPVVDMEARPVLVVEVTSPSTRESDLNDKFEEYAAIGIPHYLIVDYFYNEDGNLSLTVSCYRNTPEGYVRMKSQRGKGVWVPAVELWFSSHGDRVICKTKDMKRIEDNPGLHKRLSETEQRADAEKQRADCLAAELAELKAKLEAKS